MPPIYRSMDAVRIKIHKPKKVQLQMINAIQVMEVGNERVDSILGKEKMLVTSIFSFSSNAFKMLFPRGSSKLQITW